MVHRPERLIEIIEVLRKYKLEPKKIQFVYPKSEKDANMFMIEAVKNGRSGLKVAKALIIHDNDGNYLQEIKKMFGDGNNVATEL